MKFSLEELYYQFGQYDKVVGISFAYGSESYNKFGDFIVGILIYTSNAREDLELKLKLDPIPRTQGFQRFQENINKISDEKISELERTGFICSDVDEVLHFNTPGENQFTNTETRELPEHIKIQVETNNKGEELAGLRSKFLKGKG